MGTQARTQLQKKKKVNRDAPQSAAERRNRLFVEMMTIYNSIEKNIRAESDDHRNIASQFYKMSENFATLIKDESPNFLSLDYRSLLTTRLTDVQGYSLPNFLSDNIFRQNIYNFLKQTIPKPTAHLIESISEMMEDVFYSELTDRNIILEYSGLHSALKDQIQRIVSRASERARDVTNTILDAEVSQLFTLNRSYVITIREGLGRLYEKHRLAGASEQLNLIKERYKVPGVPEVISKWKNDMDTISEEFLKRGFKEDLCGDYTTFGAVTELQLSLHVYAEIVKTRLFDMIPMLAKVVIIHDVHKTFQDLILSAFDDDLLEELFVEDDKSRSKRNALLLSVERLRIADLKLKEISN